MTDKDLIRNEIDKVKHQYEILARYGGFESGVMSALNHILSFIDNIPDAAKFKEGDKLRYIGDREDLTGLEFTIKDVRADHYYCENGSVIPFSLQDDFEPLGCQDSDDVFDELLQELYLKYDKKVSIECLLDVADKAIKWWAKYNNK